MIVKVEVSRHEAEGLVAEALQERFEMAGDYTVSISKEGNDLLFTQEIIDLLKNDAGIIALVQALREHQMFQHLGLRECKLLADAYSIIWALKKGEQPKYKTILTALAP